MKTIQTLGLCLIVTFMLTVESEAQVRSIVRPGPGMQRVRSGGATIRTPQVRSGGPTIRTPQNVRPGGPTLRTPGSNPPSQIRPGMLNPGTLGGLGLTPGVMELPPQNGPIPLPPGPLRDFNPVPPSQPTPPSQPSPPSQNGPTLRFGGNGPSIRFGNGPEITIPLPGQMGRRSHYYPPAGTVTPPQVLGYGPNGEVYTVDSATAGSYHTPGRQLSQFNGTRRSVQRPIYDSNGNIVGYQEGEVWNNSLTGQEHGTVTNVIPNGTGGTHQSNVQYSTAGGNIQPMMNEN